MHPKTNNRLILPLVALLGLSLTLPAWAQKYQASDYLPLAVGNSWTYKHDYGDIDADYSQWSTYTAQYPETPQFTIEVLRTEEIDGQTYYVLSDLPEAWPPAPPHFIAGKKLRWNGTHLMVRTADGEQAIFRFDRATGDYTLSTYFSNAGREVYETVYDIPEVDGDNLITVRAGPNPVPWYAFKFHGNGEGGRSVSFLAGYGIHGCGWVISGEDYPLFINRLSPLHAVLGGIRVEYEDALIPTRTSSSSWGEVKQQLAHVPEGRTGR